MSIQPGTYPARAIDAVLGYASTGTEQVGVSFALLDENNAPTAVRIVWYGFFTDAASARTIESLRHCGWQGDDLSDLSTVGMKDCDVVVQEDTYDGKTRMRVAFVNAAGGGPVVKNAMDTDKARAFAARMRGVVVAANGGKASPKPTSKPAARPAPAARPKPAPPPPREPGDDTEPAWMHDPGGPE